MKIINQETKKLQNYKQLLEKDNCVVLGETTDNNKTPRIVEAEKKTVKKTYGITRSLIHPQCCRRFVKRFIL